MCDFSLEFVASRPARVGDKLVSTRFDNSFTRGFAAVGEPGGSGVPTAWYGARLPEAS